MAARTGLRHERLLYRGRREAYKKALSSAETVEDGLNVAQLACGVGQLIAELRVGDID